MYTCYQCGGKGKHYWKYSNGEYFMSDDTKHKLTCNVCEGLGQINWLENIFHNKKWVGSYGPEIINDENT